MRCVLKPIHWAVMTVVLIGLISVCGCTGYSSSTTPPVTTQVQVSGTDTVNIQNFAFNPASITVHKGMTVTWVNQDSANHEVVNDAQGSIAQGALFTSNSLQNGASYSFTFDNPGTYPYHCSIHPSMKATVIVT